MEIAKSVSDGLALLGEPAFDDAAFKRLALAAFQAVSSPGQLRTAEEAKALAERFAAETALPGALRACWPPASLALALTRVRVRVALPVCDVRAYSQRRAAG
jgi:hypothetical protein